MRLTTAFESNTKSDRPSIPSSMTYATSSQAGLRKVGYCLSDVEAFKKTSKAELVNG